MTIVHHFSSWDWLLTLKTHIAAISILEPEDLQELFKNIMDLEPGQAFLFATDMLLRLEKKENGELDSEKLGTPFQKLRIRKRLTTDGGQSQMATK